MRLHFTLKTAVIIGLFLSLTNTYAQSNAPFISQLEGMNGGKEARLTITDGILNTDYVVQYRLKNATDWIDSPFKIRKNADVIEDTLTGLESDKNYCFRVLQKDSITKAETVSNEVCSVSLKSTLISDTEVRFEWDKVELDMTKDNNVSIVYMEEDGANKNSAWLWPLSDTVWNFEYLNCSKKYRFYMLISSYSTETGPRRLTEIKSPEILVDPTLIETLPAIKESFGIVSIGSGGNNEITYNVFSVFNLPKYEYYRSVNGGEMVKLGESRLNQFDDKDVDTEKNYYCYAYRYISECGKKSELSGKSCTMKLFSETTGKFQWSPFIIEADSSLLKKEKTEYTINVIDKKGDIIKAWYSTTDTTLQLPIDEYYRYDSTHTFRVLSTIMANMTLNDQTFLFHLYAYSNTISIKRPNEVFLYPNPSDKELKIYSPQASFSYIEIIDMSGKKVLYDDVRFIEFFPVTNLMTINISDLMKGKYIVRIYDNKKNLVDTKTFMKW